MLRPLGDMDRGMVVNDDRDVAFTHHLPPKGLSLNAYAAIRRAHLAAEHQTRQSFVQLVDVASQQVGSGLIGRFCQRQG